MAVAGEGICWARGDFNGFPTNLLKQQKRLVNDDEKLVTKRVPFQLSPKKENLPASQPGKIFVPIAIL